MNPTLREIVSAYLREHGYDGLYHEPSECACLLDDLMPCASGSGCPDMDGCRAGFRVEMSNGGWAVAPQPLTKAQLQDALEELFRLDVFRSVKKHVAFQVLEAAKPSRVPVLLGRDPDGLWNVRLYRLSEDQGKPYQDYLHLGEKM